MNKAKKEKKELIKKFNAVVEDLLDNFDKYTDEEKAQVKEVFQKAAELNVVLDKYDIERKPYWTEFLNAYGQYFNAII